jgi:long-chain fatty acid transport protein
MDWGTKMRRTFSRYFSFCVVVLGLVFTSSFCYSQGVLFRGIGPVSDSMGGAAIAAPLDSAGAIYANPASIAALKDNQITFGLGIIIPKSSVESHAVAAPAITYGKANTEAGEVPTPTMATVFKSKQNSRLTYGLAVAGIGGASAVYDANTDVGIDLGAGKYVPKNPILEGSAKSSNVQIFQIMPTVSYNVTDRLAVGVTPVIGLASLAINPMQLGMPLNNAMHNFGTKYTWAGGINAGAYYDFKNHWRAGFTFKSPMWANALEYTGTDTANGAPVKNEFQLNLPMILGMGFSFDGIDKTVIACDIRYHDYENAEGFGNIISTSGTISGLGWNSVMSVSVGVERTLTDRIKVRAGYCWNENPIPSESQFANVAAPLFMQHVLGLGATYTFLKDFDVMVTWTHAFEAKVTGTVAATNSGVVSVTNTVSADTLSFGLTKRF